MKDKQGDKEILSGRGLTAYERETTINWNEEQDYATIDTRSLSVMRRLEKLGIEPVKVRESINSGAILGKLYHVPKKWVRLPRPPTKRKLTDEQKKAAGERFAKSRAERKAAS
jgi:hypothetical protein